MRDSRTRVLAWAAALVIVGAGAATFGYMAGKRREPRPMQALIDSIAAPVPPPSHGRILADIRVSGGALGPCARSGEYTLTYERTIVVELPPKSNTNAASSILSAYRDYFVDAFVKQGFIPGVRGSRGDSGSIARDLDGSFYIGNADDTVTLIEYAYGPGHRIGIVGRVYDFDGASRHVVPEGSLSDVPAKGQRVLQLDVSIMTHGFTHAGTFPIPGRSAGMAQGPVEE